MYKSNKQYLNETNIVILSKSIILRNFIKIIINFVYTTLVNYLRKI